jgi:F-type H+-transporting ATPase subunit epsilon
MSESIGFDLVSPERLLLSAAAEMVTIPGAEGDMGVMAGHMPLITTLRPGVVTVSGAGPVQRFYVFGGFAEVNPDKISLLAEEALPASELTGEVLEQRIAKAEAALAAAAGETAKAKAQEILSYLNSLKTAH